MSPLSDVTSVGPGKSCDVIVVTGPGIDVSVVVETGGGPGANVELLSLSLIGAAAIVLERGEPLNEGGNDGEDEDTCEAIIELLDAGGSACGVVCADVASPGLTADCSAGDNAETDGESR